MHRHQHQRRVEILLKENVIVHILCEVASGAEKFEIRIGIFGRLCAESVLYLEPRVRISHEVAGLRCQIAGEWHYAVGERLDEKLRDVRSDDVAGSEPAKYRLRRYVPADARARK